MEDVDLAYETGVHLGDGSMDRYRYLVSGDREKETVYYEQILAPLVRDLFEVMPTIAFQDNSVYLRVYSKELVLFKHEVLGLPIGPKEKLEIPAFARANQLLTRNLVSGVYDTDGSVKIRHADSGDYPRISLAQKCSTLVLQVKGFLATLGITSTFYRNDYFDPRNNVTETRWFLDINGFGNFDLFVSLVGTRSPYVRKRMRAVERLR